MKKKNSSHLINAIYRFSVAGVIALSLLLNTTQIALADEVPPSVAASSDPSATYVEDGAAVVVDANITVTDPDGGSISGAKVAITGNFVAGQDYLDYTTTSDVTGTYDSTRGVLTLTKSGGGSAADFQNAFRAIKYRNSNQNPNTSQRTVTFAVGGNNDYFPDTGHYYRFVSANGILWTNAKTAAAGQTLYGMTGYLATITSAGEKEYIRSKLNNTMGWLGGSDTELDGEASGACEGNWRWVTGPEGLVNQGTTCHYDSGVGRTVGGAGTPFWHGNYRDNIGPCDLTPCMLVPVSEGGTNYQDWDPGEPNQYQSPGTNEDYLHMRPTSNNRWNDLPNQGSGTSGDFYPRGYIVEFGDMPGDPVLGILTAHKTVNVQGSNDAPTDIVLSSNSVIRGQVAGTVIGTFSSTDIDSSFFTYSLVTNPNDNFQISGNQLQTTANLPNQVASYGIRVRTTDNGGLWYEENFTINVNDIPSGQYPPVISTIADQTINEDGITNAISFTVTDSNGDIQSVTAISDDQTLAPNANITLGGSNPNRTITIQPAANQYGTTIISVSARDTYYTTVRTFQLNVNPVNDVPTISDIPDKVTNEDTVKSADFTISDVDTPLNNIQITGTSSNQTLVPNGNISFSGSEANRTVTITPAANQSGTATITVTINDLAGGTASDSFVLNVIAVNDAPTDLSIAPGSIAEGQPAGSSVGTLSTTDIDNTSFTYTLVSGTGSTDNGYFTINGSALQANAVFDYETKSSYAVRVRSTDGGGLYFEKALTISVTNVNETPTNITLAGSTTLAENLGANYTIGTLSTTDPDSGSTFTYTLVSGDTTAFSIAGSTLKAAINFDYETKTSYNVTVRSTDNGTPALYFEKSFSFIITNVNEAPTISPISDLPTNEDTPVEVPFTASDPDAGTTLQYSATSTNTTLVPNANISISTSPSLKATITPVANQFGTTTITITASDGSLSANRSFTLTVNSVNDAPTNVTLTGSTMLAENLGAGYTIGTLSATDIDNTVFTYTLVSGDTGAFSIEGDTLKTAVNFDYETKNSYTVRIRATDDGTPNQYFEKDFTFTITNVNDWPTDISLSNNTLAENQPAVTVIGTLSATDQDSTSFTFTLPAGVDDNDSLQITSNQLKTKSSFDYEAKASYAITVQVDDGAGGTYQEAFTISVTNVNESPSMDAIADQETNEDFAKEVPITASDPDAGTTLQYQATSSNTTLIPNENISISTEPSLIATIAPVANLSGSATITIIASDGTLTAERSFTLTVHAINDAPTNITLSSTSVIEHPGIDLVIGTLTTEDIDSSSFTYSLVAGDGEFSIDGNQLKTDLADYDPETDYSITVRSDDGAGGIFDKEFTITVSANQAPTLAGLPSDKTIYEDNNTGAMAFTISDDESDPLSLVGVSSNQTLVPDDNIVFGGSGANRTVTITPVAQQFGSATITIRVSDPYHTTSADINLVVNSVNDAPTNISLTGSTTLEENLGAGYTIGSLSTTDVDSSVFTYSLVSGATTAFTIEGNTLKAAINFNYEVQSSYNVRIRSTDNGTPNQYYEKDFSFTITNVNEAPTISAISDQTTNEDTSKTIFFRVEDPENALQSVTPLSANESVLPSSNIVITTDTSSPPNNRKAILSPALNQNSAVPFNVTISAYDGTYTTTMTFGFTVTPVNDNPTDISLSNNSISENNAIGDLIGTMSSTDVDSSSFTYSVTGTDASAFTVEGDALKAAVVFDCDTKATYNITLNSNDGSGGSYSEAFTITVTNENEPPTISAIPDDHTDEDTPKAIFFRVDDPENAIQSVTASSTNESVLPSSNIVITTDTSVPPNNRKAVLTPALNQYTDIPFDVTISVYDGTYTATSTFSLTAVTAVNDNPDNISLSTSNVDENKPADTVVGSFSATDVDSSAFTYSLVTGSGDTDNASFKITGNQLQTNASFNYEAKNSYSIRVQAADDGSPTGSYAMPMTITIDNVNEAPVISEIATPQDTNENSPKSIPFTVSDPEGDSLTFSKNSSNETLLPASNIVITGTGSNQTATLTPATNRNNSNSGGPSTVTISASDGPNTVEKVFTFNVAAIDNETVISDINDQAMAMGDYLEINFNITDVDDDVYTFGVTATPSNPNLFYGGVVIVEGAGSERILVLASTAQTGESSVTVRVSKDGTTVAEKTFNVSVTGENIPPIISSVLDQNTYEDATIGPIYFSIEDKENPGDAIRALRDYVKITSLNTGLVPNNRIALEWDENSPADYNMYITPLPDRSGESNIEISVFDGYRTTIVEFKLTVSPVNDSPELVKNVNVPIKPGQTLSLTNAMLQVTDIDNTPDQLTYHIAAAPANGTIYFNGDTPLGVDDEFTQADINSGVVSYAQTLDLDTNDWFDFYVNDLDSASPADANEETPARFNVRGTVVTTKDDNKIGSLRNAISNALPGDTVTFDDTLAGETITVESLITINKNLTISARGIHNVTISGENTTQIFTVNAGVIALVEHLTFSNGTATEGGAIENNGTLTIKNATFSDNNATGKGGAIINKNTGLLTVTNTTFSNNGNNIETVEGGALYNDGGTMVLNSVTIANTRNGNGLKSDTGTTTITNSLLADNNPADCDGSIVSNGYNLVKNAGVCTFSEPSDILNTDFSIDPLADNGGDTFTHALPFRSPALDTGSCTGGLTEDQAGMSRPQGPGCDIGAYEFPVPMEIFYDDTAPEISYTNGAAAKKATQEWNRDDTRGIHLSSKAGNYATFTFYGDRLTLRYLQAKVFGKVDIFIDDIRKARISQKGKTGTQEWSIDNLGDSKHILRIVHKSGRQANLDAIIVRQRSEGVSVADGTIEENDLRISYSGYWSWDSMQAISNTKSNTATIRFHGARVGFIFTANRRNGTLDATIDGVQRVKIDERGKNNLRVFWFSPALPDGDHTLVLRHLNKRSINFDQIIVMDAAQVANPSDIIQGNDTSMINYSGVWMFNDTQAISLTKKNTASIKFTGNSITLNYLLGKAYGVIDVYVDGIKKTRIDQRKARKLPTYIFENLGAGEHELMFRHMSGKTPNLMTIEIGP